MKELPGRAWLVLVVVGCRAPVKPAHEDTAGMSDRTNTGTGETDADADIDTDTDGDTDADADTTTTPERHVSTADDYVAIDGHGLYACATHADGSVDCWGDPDWSFREHIDGPVQDVRVEIGGFSVSWTDSAGAVQATYYGLPDSTDTVYDAAPVVSLGGGCCSDDCVVLETGTITCWEYPYEFTGGYDQHTPEWPTDEDSFTQAAYFGGYGCALRADGSVRCWGNDQALIDATPSDTFSSIGVGIGVTTAGDVRTWAPWMDEWEAFDNGPYIAVIPSQGSSTVDGACAIRVDGTLDCRSRRATTDNSVLPAEDRFLDVTSPNQGPICAVRADGHVECFDTDSYRENQHTILYPP